MKFDYYGNNIDFNHQISQPNLKNLDVDHGTSRESVKSHRKHNNRITFLLILLEILIILLCAGYYISPLNHITSVSVNGNRTIMSQSIISDTKSNPGDSVLRLMAHETHYEKSAFERNAQLKTIHVHVNQWNHVKINVKEYPIIAYLNLNHHYFAVSNNGKRAYQDTKPNQVDPILYNFKSESSLNSFIKVYKQLPDSVKPDIDKIYYEPTKIDPNRIRINMNDGNQVYADLRSWDKKMKYYSAISKSMKKRGIVNLELGAYSAPFKKVNHK